MKALSMTICAVICCLGNPAQAAPVCLDCSLPEAMRLHQQYNEMKQIKERQRQQQQQIDRYKRQQRWN